MSLETIANKIREIDKNIVLIFAFNATGKTRLSVAYKDLTKDQATGKHAGVYYNAFSEDLFVWDNDEDNHGANKHLNIVPSSLNRFHSFLYDNPNDVMEKLALYSPTYRFRFNAYDDVEKGIESVTFFIEGEEETPIKISRGEERIFVWCFFLALLEVDGWADEQDAHIFIDDPVSSLDEHNIFITVDSIFQQIEKHYLKKRIIITTHHIGLFSILANRLTKGEKSGRYKDLTALRILKRTGEGLELVPLNKDVFLYHLHLLQVLDEASRGQLYTYHFALLRQLIESISSFLGSGIPSYILERIGISNTEEIMLRINTHSHKSIYYDQTELMNTADEAVFNDILRRVIETYKFRI